MNSPDDWTFEHLPLPALLWPSRWSGVAPRPNAAFTRTFGLDLLLARRPDLGHLPDGAHVLRLGRPGAAWDWDARVCRLHLGTRPDGSRLALVVDLQAEYQDPLTGLEDRRALLLDTGETAQTQLGSLALLDVDGFKEVNDTLGHKAGDDALRALAELLAAAARSWGARAYRLGGDEFVVCAPGYLGARELGTVQAQFAEHLAAQLPGTRLRGAAPRSFSYGLAQAPQDGAALAELLRCADARLAGSKKRRRGTQAAQVARLQERPAAVLAPDGPALLWPGLSWLPLRKNA
ncbi:GGDEF domain-containing protein [Deinococcus sp. Leaf326]|uniref:GGDEF domain-containing protein n=1 Tax=Deinococcus sp. Leaf326 TaxID=1736338 RepID=UPI0006F89271|nr:GGDEF domain-containing protein [Deinococcus sp. Leaf326]KQR22968.1 hypothetical protein ASF71_07350 [Deinococcus sp. Leaf326]